MAHRVAFGVGCFHFSFWRRPPAQLTPAAYVEAVRTCLESVPAVNNLSVDADESFPVKPITLETRPSFENGEKPFLPLFLTINFELYIPARLQDDLGFPGASKGTKTEHFAVHIENNYHAPVTFVSLLRPGSDPDPSRAVVVIREYFRKHLPKDSDVTFEAIGPSPFHADFFLCEDPTSTAAPPHPFTTRKSRPRGYAIIEFQVAPGVYPDIDDAYQAVRHTLGGELGLYYEIKRAGLSRQDAWMAIEADLDQLIDPPTTNSSLQRIKRSARGGKVLRKLRGELTRFEVRQLIEQHATQRAIQDTFSLDEPPNLREYIDEAFQGQRVFPGSQLTGLVEFLEERRSKVLEFVIVVVAALIGGAVGALATLLATRISS